MPAQYKLTPCTPEGVAVDQHTRFAVDDVEAGTEARLLLGLTWVGSVLISHDAVPAVSAEVTCVANVPMALTKVYAALCEHFATPKEQRVDEYALAKDLGLVGSLDLSPEEIAVAEFN
jgi:hypothetical protein